MTLRSLRSEELYTHCDLEALSFSTTAELPQASGLAGQVRAAEAVEFGIGIRRDGYNLFVMGAAGTGKHTMVRELLAQRVDGETRPSDWVYVNNFGHAYKPVAIELAPGRGGQLRDDMRRLVEDLRIVIPAVFDSDEYRSRSEQIDGELGERQEKAFAELGEEAEGESIALLRTPNGFSLAPSKDGEVLSAEKYEALPEAEKERIQKSIAGLQQKLERLVRMVPQLRRERFDRVKALNQEMTLLAVGHLVDDLAQRYEDVPKLRSYFEAVRQDVIESREDFLPEQKNSIPFLHAASEGDSLRRYDVNVVIDHSGGNGIPLVVEDHPTYGNLIGRVDHISQFGTLITDFGLIKPGALHRANGGYLLLDAHRLLTQPYAWEGLKRALRTRGIRIESLGEMYSLVSTVSLEPESIPLQVKVILFGERELYHLLQAYDPDFKELFKVAVDFDDDIKRDAGNRDLYAHVLASIARRKDLLPLDRSAVGRLIEHSARMSGDAQRLSADLRRLGDLVGEADHGARTAGGKVITADDVQRAIHAQQRRADRLRERIQDTILRGTIMIDSEGSRVGQVNGLSVYVLGEHAFGEPTRITATTRVGDGQIIDVQREVELGGAIHSKGVLILSAFLAARFATREPYALSASLVFEQTYGTVEGDSASVAELVALMSSLADVPVNQALAVTGSVNQLGQVQAIGGVNEKIEGFFDICRARGLTGRHGVIIPAANVEHLMLRSDVVAAVAQERFKVWAASEIDEVIELMTGLPAGDRDAGGAWSADTVNGRIARRLRTLTRERQLQMQRVLRGANEGRGGVSR